MARVDRAAVLGSGVMGATIAAHLANAGIRVLLLDVVPKDGGDRNKLARGAIEALEKSKPAAAYLASSLSLIEPGNLEDDLPKLATCDWVVEVVVENMAVKKQLLGEKVAPHLRADAILSTNTSGLSVNEIASALPEALRPRFLVTHFFNPPRYMRLVEVVSSRFTDPAVAASMAELLGRRLGKGVVVAKDTPNFVANRIGVFSMCNAIHHTLEMGMTVEEVDALAGPATARARSACFRTADIVGIDTLLHVARNSYDALPDDERRDTFRMPEVMNQMVAKGLLGNKSRQGFFKKTKGEKAETFFYDLVTGEYRPSQKPRFPSADAAKGIDDPAARLRAVLAGKDKGAELAWRNLRDTLVYSFNRVPEIADDYAAVDDAMRWGFNWELGPFEMLDAVGVAEFVKRAEADGVAVPPRLRLVDRFYVDEGARRRTRDPATLAWKDVVRPEGSVDLLLLKKGGAEVERNAGASLVDLGDGVFCLEFHTKMNAIGGDVLSMVHKAVARAEAEGVGLVVANQGTNFSVGANLALLVAAIAEGAFDEVDLTVKAFQKAMMALKYARVPVVAAPHAMALGGGCEVCLHSDAVNALAETYMGLVEIGVGLLPAGGGTKEMALRAVRAAEAGDADPSPFVFKAFQTIAMAKVSTSAAEAAQLGFLRPGDAITFGPDRLVHDAKQKVIALSVNYRPGSPATDVRAPGRSVAASMGSQLWNLRMGGFVTGYEEKLGRTIASVITGGDVAAGTPVTEQWFLDLEREAFLRLCGERKTVERIQHMLKKGKPLRN
ncbi:MAG TPA: 3-hydroxyacyl-CoA dehydrogenase/enoyl-CoA hydratase family protein [Anaeromyxobacteraceae bacterium]|nr:3-hydroxyacyl-CoA dehydrogenase/enoyl-CoA hydratase family protein [Anaeromyxobacteraceae bacterium]